MEAHSRLTSTITSHQDLISCWKRIRRGTVEKVTNHQQMELRANKPKEVTRTPEYPNWFLILTTFIIIQKNLSLSEEENQYDNMTLTKALTWTSSFNLNITIQFLGLWMFCWNSCTTVSEWEKGEMDRHLQSQLLYDFLRHVICFAPARSYSATSSLMTGRNSGRVSTDGSFWLQVLRETPSVITSCEFL